MRKQMTKFWVDETSNVAIVREVVARLAHEVRQDSLTFTVPLVAGIQFRTRQGTPYISYDQIVEELPLELIWLPLRGVSILDSGYEGELKPGHYRYYLYGKEAVADVSWMNHATPGYWVVHVQGKSLFDACYLYKSILDQRAAPRGLEVMIDDHLQFFDGELPELPRRVSVRSKHDG